MFFKNLYLADNLKSGLIVSLVALPLCLGIALASGAPLISGLIAGIVGGVVVGLISNSPLSVSGPAAGLAVIIFQGIAEIGSFQIFTYSVVLAGVIQIILGFAKAGKITDFLPHSVIEGMMASIGLLLIIKQLPYIFGVKKLPEVLDLISSSMPITSFGAISIGFFSMLMFIIYRNTFLVGHKFFKVIPFPLLLVIVTSFGAVVFQGTSMSLIHSDFVNVGAALGNYKFTDNISQLSWSNLTNSIVLKYAVLLAIVASIETLLCIEAGDKLDKQGRKTNKDLELKAQGFANLISGLLGGLAITSVVVRTSANADAGAKNKLSAIIHGLILLLSLVLFPGLIDMIPLAVLASILIFTGYNLANPKLFKKMYHHGIDQFIPFMTTIFFVLTLDLLKGVLIGILAAIMMTLKDHYHVQNVQLESDDSDKKRRRLNFGHHVTFIHKKEIRSLLAGIPSDSECEIDFSKTIHVDGEMKQVFHEFFNNAEKLHIGITVINKDCLK